VPLRGFDPTSHSQTLAAVIVGAILAAIGGLVGNQVEAYVKRRERERAAALLFGEVTSTLMFILQMADRTRKIGEPYGPVTRRMLLAARRELDLYERNRETLLDLRDPALRVDIHSLVVRIAMPLDGVLETYIGPPPETDTGRDQSFAFMMAQVARLPQILIPLGKLARHDFENHAERLGRGGAPATFDSSAMADPGDAGRAVL
jgi:hypothetical protein